MRSLKQSTGIFLAVLLSAVVLLEGSWSGILVVTGIIPAVGFLAGYYIIGALLDAYIISNKIRVILTILYLPLAISPLVPHFWFIATFPIPSGVEIRKIYYLPQSGPLRSSTIEVTTRTGAPNNVTSTWIEELKKRGWKECPAARGYSTAFIKWPSVISVGGPQVYNGDRLLYSLSMGEWARCPDDDSIRLF